MSQRITKPKPQPTEKREVEKEHSAPAKQELKQEIDDLLDEIDGVLEHNAEEFVRNYVQKGGE